MIVEAAGLGLVLGVVTGLPLGIVNVAIVDAASRGRVRFAIGIGLGGALADATHATIAALGVAHVLEVHPAWTRGLAVVTALLVAGYVLVRRQQRPLRGEVGIVAGALLTLPNPAALAAWIAITSALRVDPGWAFGAGVGLGSALWFTALARWVGSHAEHPAWRWVGRAAAVLLLGLAAFGIVRTFV